MKRLLLFAALVVCMAGTSFAQESKGDLVEPLQVETEAQYKDRYKSALDFISAVARLSKSYIIEIRSVWIGAIKETVNNNKYVYHGKRCKDFNEAIAAYFEEWRNLDFGSLEDYEELPGRVKEQIKSLNKYPYSLRDAFEGILELGMMVDELCSYTIHPTGSYESYYQTTDDLILNIDRKLYELEMRYTD